MSMITGKIIIVMSTNMPGTITEQQRYCQKCIEKGRHYYKGNKERLQNLGCDWYKILSNIEKK